MATQTSPNTGTPLGSAASSLVGAESKTESASAGWGLAARALFFALIFLAEWIPIAVYLHDGGHGAAALLEITIVSCSLILAIGLTKYAPAFRQISSDVARVSIGWTFLAAHLLPYAGFLWLCMHPSVDGMPARAHELLWYTSGILAIALCGSAFVPPRSAWRLLRSTGYTWIFALAVAFVARFAVSYVPFGNGAAWDPALSFNWTPVTNLTFTLVKFFLQFFVRDLVANRATMTIGSQSFAVNILPWCAGFEGTALMLVFSVAWLAFFRREFRFPNALLLVPAGMAVIWVANALRITALILIGVAGAPKVATGGFHSQAGWIAFNCVALGFVLISRRLPWVTVEGARLAPATSAEKSAPSPTTAYLLPFLVIVAAGMISSAASGGFEWLYPLRFIAAAVTLWIFRSTYAKLDWRFGWFGVLTGIAVLALWLGLDRFSGAQADNGIAAGLASLSAVARISWLALRIAGAVVTVPIAEELVFRGFLIRRLISSDFESVDPRRYTWLSLLISSVAFGLLHGDRWLAGILAGLLYAAAYLRRGRIGDAVIAHATTNALLAAWVLQGSRWYLW